MTVQLPMAAAHNDPVPSAVATDAKSTQGLHGCLDCSTSLEANVCTFRAIHLYTQVIQVYGQLSSRGSQSESDQPVIC